MPDQNGVPVGTEPTSTNPQTSKTYTQADIDTIVGKVKGRLSDKFQETLSSEREKAIEEFKASRGITDDLLDQMTNKESHQIEINKRDAELKKLVKDLEAVSSERELLKNKYVTLLTRNHVGSVANKLESNDPDLIHLILEKNLAIDDEGNVLMKDGTSVEDAVKKILSDKPYLRKASASGGGGFAGNAGGKPDPKEDLLTAEGRKRFLQKMGVKV